MHHTALELLLAAEHILKIEQFTGAELDKITWRDQDLEKTENIKFFASCISRRQQRRVIWVTRSRVPVAATRHPRVKMSDTSRHVTHPPQLSRYFSSTPTTFSKIMKICKLNPSLFKWNKFSGRLVSSGSYWNYIKTLQAERVLMDLGFGSSLSLMNFISISVCLKCCCHGSAV